MKTTMKSGTAIVFIVLALMATQVMAWNPGNDSTTQKKVRKVQADKMRHPIPGDLEDMEVPMPPPPPPPAMPGMEQELASRGQEFQSQMHGPRLPGLSDQQKGEIKKLTLKQVQNVTPIKNQIREKTARLNSVLSAQPFNETEAFQLAEEIGKLKTSILKLQISMHQEIRKLLTPDQQIIFDSRPKPFLNPGKQLKKQQMIRGKNL